MTPLSKKPALIDSSLESSNFREHQTHVHWSQKVFHSVTLAGMMTFPACCQHIPEGRPGILVQVKTVSSIVLFWHCWDAFLFMQQLPENANSIAHPQEIKEKTEAEKSEGKLLIFSLNADRILTRAYWLEQHGFLLFAECYRWLPRQEALPLPLTGLWGMQGAWNQPSPSLPNLFFKPLLSRKKKKKEGEKRGEQCTSLETFLPICFLWNLELTSSLPIRIAIYNFAGISLMSWINSTSSLKCPTIWVEL